MDPLPIFSFSKLKETNKKDINDDISDILSLWFQDILSERRPGDDSMQYFPRISIHKVIEKCLLQRDAYTAKWLQNMVLSNEDLSKTYGKFLPLRLNASSYSGKKHSLEEIEMEVAAFKKRLCTSLPCPEIQDEPSKEEDHSMILLEGGWRKWQGEWTPVPIGVP